MKNLILIAVETEASQQQSNNMKLSDFSMSTQEQSNYVSYKNVVRNSDDDKAVNDLKND